MEAVRVQDITWDETLYRVELENSDHFYLSEREKKILDSLEKDESLRVQDMGRVLIPWRDEGHIVAYEKEWDGEG